MVRITQFGGEYAQVAAWTGQTEEQLREVEDYHDEDRDHWLAWDGDQVVGVLDPWHAPDGRHRLFFDKCRADAYAPLAAAVDGPCYVTVQAGSEALGPLTTVGFEESRREHDYEIPVAWIDTPTPDGLWLISAANAEIEKLMMLDCALREDVPGADGWQPDPVWFREETFGVGFDPLTYRVAVDSDDRHVGLARVWLNPGRTPRLGMVGVLPAYRRKGLGRALIAQAFAVLSVRGVPVVTAEVDVTNAASNALMRSLGGRVTGGSVELFRPR
jgi:GNAT superfamily N-acetyltransferase